MAFDIHNELMEIGRLMESASLLMTVKNEVAKIKKDGGFSVTAGEHSGHGNWEVVVKSGGEEEDITRRIRSSIEGVEIARLAAGVIGIRQSRRQNNSNICEIRSA